MIGSRIDYFFMRICEDDPIYKTIIADDPLPTCMHALLPDKLF